MGKPAARVGDPTAHGGTIVGPGSPNVFIGKMPAATMGDMHVCPMCTPGVPPIPHVGGPITLGSTGVFINGKPAARMGDLCICVGPPSTVIFGCPTVLIGEAGGGGGGGGAISAAAAYAAKMTGAKAIKAMVPPEIPKDATGKNHLIECLFMDAAGKALAGVPYRIKDPKKQNLMGASTNEGKVYHAGYFKPDSFEAHVLLLKNAKWKKTKLKLGEPAEFSVEADLFQDDLVYVNIYELRGNTRRWLDSQILPVKGGKAEGVWKPTAELLGVEESVNSVDEDGGEEAEPKPILEPAVYEFVCDGLNVFAASNKLTLVDDFEIELLDEENKGIAGAEYEAEFKGGEKKKGKLDSSGKAKMVEVEPSAVKVRFPKVKEKNGNENAGAKAGNNNESEIKKPFEGCIFYSPKHEEYLVLETQDQFKAFSTAVEKSHALRGKTSLAWKEATPKKRQEALEKVRKEWKELFNGGTEGDADQGLEELLNVAENKAWAKTTAFVHVPVVWRKNGKKIPGRWAKHSDKALQKALDEQLKKSEEKSNGSIWHPNIKAKLFGDTIVAGSPWPWANGKKESKGEHFEFSSEAALGRYVMGFSGDGEINLKERKVSLATSGEASFALIEGKHSGKVFLPDRDGVNLLEFLCNVKGKNLCLDNGRECRLRLTIEAELGLFTGISASGAICFPAIDLSKDIKKQKAKVGANANVMVGTQAKGSLTLKPEWGATAQGEFNALGEIGGEAGATGGLAAGLSFEVSYKNGRFHIHFKASAAFGLGGSSGWKFDVDLAEGIEFIDYLLHSVDCHFVAEITKEAFVAYKDYSFAMVVYGAEAVRHGALKLMEEVHNFGKWLENNRETLQEIKHEIWRNPMRERTYSLVPPETLGQTLVTIMQTREETDFSAIMDILRSAKSQHTLKWILRSVAQKKLPEKNHPDYEKQSGEALRLGIQKVREFGLAKNLKRDDTFKDPNTKFVVSFNEILKENYIKDI